MPNPGTANLLFEVVSESRKEPGTVMLGHISSQRNEPVLAVGETRSVFDEAGKNVEFELLTAPLRECGEIVKIL